MKLFRKLLVTTLLLSLYLNVLYTSNAYAWSSTPSDNGREIFDVNNPSTGNIRGNHQWLAEEAARYVGDLSTEETYALILGSVVADSKLKYVNGYTCFHGFENYIDAFEYLSSIADTIKTDSPLFPSDSSNPIHQQINNGLNFLKSSDWSSHFYHARDNVRVTVNDNNLKLFILGMSLHIAADAYAHRTYKLQNSAWVELNHASGADLHNETPERYDVTEWVCKYILQKWQNKSVRDYSLFKFYRNSFRLENLYDYSLEVHPGSLDPTIAVQLKAMSFPLIP